MSRKVMKLSAFALLIIMLLSSCSETIQTISPTAEPSETETLEIVETKTPIESGIPETTPTPTPNVTPTPTVEPTPPKKEKITKDQAYSLWKYNDDSGCLSYEKAVDILGVEGYYIDESNYKEYQWDVDTGEYVYFRCHIEKENGKEVRYIVPLSRDFENYSVKDTPDFFRTGTPVSYEDCQKIKADMSYQEVIAILGEPNLKEDLMSGPALFEWDVNNGQYFYIIYSGWAWNVENSYVKSYAFTEYTLKNRDDIVKPLSDD